ncbi:MAG TPA: prephenate dehydrogenase [Flavitalea sp.]|nr:prephenate dehydrogenase [Flavitalea sp.]
MHVTIIGTGLIGGSLALSIREKGLAQHITGVDANLLHARRALELKLVDEITTIEKAISKSDLIIIAIPVNSAEMVLKQVLDQIDRQVVMDVGSTKLSICSIAAGHLKRGRLVATHPMWGTEYSGPEAAVKGAFIDKAVVICNREDSDQDALAIVETLYRDIGMHLLYMHADAHDLHAAYVSHIAHITSFALANTVLEKERQEDAIFEMASAGFESTVRLAKSNPAMWVPIFMQNRENVLDVLNEHISQLRKFKSCLEKENYEYLEELIVDANKIRKIIG